jgi:hypothetical protein
MGAAVTSAADALQAGLDYLADAPLHDDHRHAITIGMTVDTDGDLALIAAVQGVPVAVFVTVTPMDLDRIRTALLAAATERGPVQ